MSFARIEQEDRRLVLLRLLAEDRDYKVNTSILQQGLELYGHSVSRDKLHAEIAWLKEVDLVSFEQIDSVKVVTLNQRGLDVSQGRATVSGVKRPGPGA
ncbi:MAG: ArsR family transcriptional regulator [Pseudomonadales bacterium]